MAVPHRSTCSRHPVRTFLYQTLGRRSSSTVLQVLPASGTVLPDRGISGNPSRSAQHAEVHFDELRRELLGLPEVAAVYVVVGSQDVLIHVAVRDVEHLRTLVGETLTSRRDIAHIETSLIFEFTRKPALPNYGEQ